MYNKSYIEINLDILSNNVKNIINKFNNYEYYIANVKSNAYSHGYYIIDTLIKSGINYLATSTLDEAIEIRKYNKDISILCTQIIDIEDLKTASDNNITITVDSINYLNKINNIKLNIHIKIDSGMNRLGVKTKEEFNQIYNYISSQENLNLEGIYTHLATPGIIDKYYDEQINNFKSITSDINLKDIKIVHIFSSFMLLSHRKLEFANGFRIGTIIYGYDISLKEYSTDIKDQIKKLRDKYYQKKYSLSKIIRGNIVDLKPAFKIKSKVMEIKNVKKGQLLGYGINIAKKDMKIAILPIGYDSGIGNNIKNRFVLINNKKYRVVAPICMCMMIIKIDNNVKLNDEVTILGDNLTLGYLSRLNNKSIQETLVNLGNNLKRVYIKDNKIDNIL